MSNKYIDFDTLKFMLYEVHGLEKMLNKKKLIHAFGPMKKVIIMSIAKTITDLEKKSLPLLSIKRPFK